MTGGYDDNNKIKKELDTVEMINLETMSSCIINVNLDEPRYAHTADGNLVCGGYTNRTLSSCFDIATRTTINLLNARYTQTSWSTNDGLYLLGGIPDNSVGKTTELITGDTTQAGFTLKYTP